jgi:hypothetical protein
MAGRPYPFIVRGKQLTSTADPDYPTYLPSGPGTDVTGTLVAFTNGTGAWAHNNNFNVNTWSADGRVAGVGACSINCSNYRGVYSFHTPGAFAAFGDGSVRLLTTSLPEQTFMALVTATCGEVVGDF